MSRIKLDPDLMNEMAYYATECDDGEPIGLLVDGSEPAELDAVFACLELANGKFIWLRGAVDEKQAQAFAANLGAKIHLVDVTVRMPAVPSNIEGLKIGDLQAAFQHSPGAEKLKRWLAANQQN